MEKADISTIDWIVAQAYPVTLNQNGISAWSKCIQHLNNQNIGRHSYRSRQDHLHRFAQRFLQLRQLRDLRETQDRILQNNRIQMKKIRIKESLLIKLNNTAQCIIN